MAIATKIVGLAALVTAVYAVKTYATKEQVDALLEVAEGESGPRGMAMVSLFFFFGAVFALPVTPVEVLAGYKYGLAAGFMVVVIGKQLGGMAAYWLGRTVFRDFVRNNIVPQWKILQALDGAFKEEGFKMALVFRSMYIPTPVKNYGCAALGCSFWHATGASMIFGPLYAAANLYAGAMTRSMRDVSGGGEVDYVALATKVLMGGAFVIGSYVAVREVKTQLGKLTAELEEKVKEDEAKKAR
jgi:uncharacterized membrane protein YdjX (TVP38/TMEM64 family)